MESKDYAWKWVTAAECLCKTVCELCYLKVVASGETADVDIYDGKDTGGTLIITMNSAGKYNAEMLPFAPIYCRRGLYIDDLTAITGILVQWRVLPS